MTDLDMTMTPARFVSDEEGRDFVFENEWDTCIPVSFETDAQGGLVVTCFPELTDLLVPHFARFRRDPFSQEALAALWELLAPFMRRWGYTDDRFRDRWGYILRLSPGMSVLPSDGSSRRLTQADETGNQTTFDLDTSLEEGLLAYGTEEAGRILSVAITHAPVPDEPSVTEVGVETIPSARRRGFAAANLAALSADLLSRGHTVEYRCQRYNRASKKTAEKVGFVPTGRYYFYVGRRVNHI